VKPRHVAIIMDGNGRWAQARDLPRSEGHRAGQDAVRRAVTCAAEEGIAYLTLYSFSEENWQRPLEEVEALMALLVAALKNETDWMQQNGVRLNVIGATHKFSAAVQQSLSEALAATSSGSRLTLTLALSYGGRQEIIQAVNNLLATGKNAAVTEDFVAQHLYTKDLPDPDIILRTGGEYRLSNFLLWQAAYSELIFMDVFWPDFSGDHLREALAIFARRQRRYGRVEALVEVAP
jgi:undecaprenyl diphosphate synthase